jgi:hypothetical protein
LEFEIWSFFGAWSFGARRIPSKTARNRERTVTDKPIPEGSVQVMSNFTKGFRWS